MNHALTLAIAFCLTTAVPAWAVDFNKELTQIDGSPFKDEKGVPITTSLGKVVEQALLATYNDERDPQTGKELITPQDKFERWKLATKVAQGGNVALSSEELTLVKKLIGKGYPPLVVGQAWTLLDPGMK